MSTTTLLPTATAAPGIQMGGGAGGDRRLREAGGAGHGDAPRAPADVGPAARRRRRRSPAAPGADSEAGAPSATTKASWPASAPAASAASSTTSTCAPRRARTQRAQLVPALGCSTPGGTEASAPGSPSSASRRPASGSAAGERGHARPPAPAGGGEPIAPPRDAHEQRARPGVDVGRRRSAGRRVLAQQRLDPVLERLRRAHQVGARGQRRRRRRAPGSRRAAGSPPGRAPPAGATATPSPISRATSGSAPAPSA